LTSGDDRKEKGESRKEKGKSKMEKTMNIEHSTSNIERRKTLCLNASMLEFTAPSSCGHGIFDPEAPRLGIFDFSVGFEEVSKYQSVKVLNIRANCKSQNQRR
jgi:hypothetical protein